MRPISEKAAEILFNRFMLQTFGLREVQFFAPSSFEERRNGYDAKVVGFKQFREIVLQFKAPDFVAKWNRFTVRTTPHQHEILKTEYPKRTAYYVAPMFASIGEMNEVQAVLKTAEDFLKNFVCIEVSQLPFDVRSLHYFKPENHLSAPKASFKTSTNGKGRDDTKPISPEGWERGSSLLKKFRDGKVGWKVDLDGTLPVEKSLMPRNSYDSNSEQLSPSEHPIHIRLPQG